MLGEEGPEEGFSWSFFFLICKFSYILCMTTNVLNEKDLNVTVIFYLLFSYAP